MAFIVTVNQPLHHRAFTMPGHLGAASPFESEAPDFHDDGREENFRNLTTVFAEPAQLPAVVDAMTRLWPGEDVCVYEMKEVAFRTPGELQKKDVSTLGVLPV